MLKLNSKESKREIKILLSIQFSLMLFVYFVYGIRTTPDSFTMSKALEIMYSGYPEDYDTWASSSYALGHRILRPLGLFFAYPFKNLGSENAFAINSAIFQFLIVLYLYKFTTLLFNDSKFSFYTVLLFLLSPLVLHNTLLVMLDMGTWFLYLVTLYYSYLEFERNTPRLNVILTLCFFSGISFLMKENAGSTIIFINLMILFSKTLDYTFSQRVNFVCLTSFIFLIPVILNNFIIEYFYDYSYYEWWTHPLPHVRSDQDFIYFIQFIASMKNAYGFLLFFILFYLIKNEQAIDHKIFFIWTSSLLIFIINPVSARFLFLTFPIALPFAAKGILSFEKSFLRKVLGKYSIFILTIIITTLNYVIFIDNLEYLGAVFN